VSPTSRFATLVPLLLVLAVTAAKEIFEDMCRHQQDRHYNKSTTRVLRKVKDESRISPETARVSKVRFVDVSWEDLEVGDLVEIRNGEGFPADLLLLASSEPDGFAYIETSNLDGETNLKIRQALPETSQFLHTIRDLDEVLEGYVLAEQPNNQIYHFEGILELGCPEKRYPLSEERILLRGSTLRNSKWIFGAVLYTGHDTKLMRNAAAAPIKRTFVERMTNVQIVFLFIALTCLALISVCSHLGCSLFDGLWLDRIIDVLFAKVCGRVCLFGYGFGIPLLGLHLSILDLCCSIQ
jgi:phospholipid-transporting ATPase